MHILALEGNTQKLDGGAMFGNAPRSMWEGWQPPDEKNRIELACRALLLKTDDGRNLLFETGIGAFFEPKLRERFGITQSRHVLLDSLKNAGLEEGDIDAVILSHLHFDHAGGLLSAFEDGAPRLLFPNAKIYVGKEHWSRAVSPHSRDRASFIPVLNDLLKESGRLVLVGSDGKSDLAPLVKFRYSDGHTIGLMMSEIALADGPIVFCSDLIPGLSWVHLPITMGYDRYAELVIDEKRILLEDLVNKNGKLFFTHDLKFPCGVVRRDEKGKFFAQAVHLSELH